MRAFWLLCNALFFSISCTILYLLSGYASGSDIRRYLMNKDWFTILLFRVEQFGWIILAVSQLALLFIGFTKAKRLSISLAMMPIVFLIILLSKNWILSNSVSTHFNIVTACYPLFSMITVLVLIGDVDGARESKE